MKLRHSFACIMIGCAAISGVPASEAGPIRYADITPEELASSRFDRYCGLVAQRLVAFGGKCEQLKSELALDLSVTHVRSARQRLVSDAKRHLKSAQSVASAEIRTLGAAVRSLLGVQPAGVALIPSVDEIETVALRRINHLGDEYGRKFQSMLW